MHRKEEVRNGEKDAKYLFREVAQVVAESPNDNGREFYDAYGEPDAEG